MFTDEVLDGLLHGAQLQAAVQNNEVLVLAGGGSKPVESSVWTLKIFEEITTQPEINAYTVSNNPTPVTMHK